MSAAAEVEEHAHGGGALQTAKDLFAGAAGGVAQVLSGELTIPLSFPALISLYFFFFSGQLSSPLCHPG